MMKKHVKSAALTILTLILLSAGALVTMIVGSAEEYCTVRIDYLFQNGEKAYDSYIAVFEKDEETEVDVTVTNPTISGYRAVNSPNEAEAQPAPTTRLTGKMTENRTLRVWYVPDIVPYTVKYYKQNVYDDDYTADLTLDDAYYDKSGKTGTFPSDLENVTFTGFTKLYHKPDFIAADGSTEFELYYTRNYYLINFDLDGGHGVEPVYAKYQSNYNIPEPARKGYVFEGWVLSDKNGNYVDEQGNILTDEQAYAAAQKFTSGIVPDHNVNYKAYWTASAAQYTIVYWIEDPDSDQYTGVATQTITQYRNKTAVTTGDTLDLEDRNKIPDFFTDYNLNPQKVKRDSNGNVILDKDLRPTYLTNADLTSYHEGDPIYAIDEYDHPIDFPDMSPGEREELNGKWRYFEVDTVKTLSSMTVSGDGSTRFNVYYKRRPITQRFFFARKTADGKYQVPGYTKAFSNNAGTLNQHLLDKWGNNTPNDTHWMELSTELPKISEKYKNKLTIKTHHNDLNGADYYYYELKTEYYSDMRDNWLTDAFEPYEITNNKSEAAEGEKDYARFGAWSAEWGTPYAMEHDNKTVKGFYEKLDDNLLYTEDYLGADYVDDPLVLNYLSFWANAKNKDWNKKDAIYNFTYHNYVELLPSEYDANGNWNGTGGYTSVIAVNYEVESGNQVMHSQRKLYGLLPKNITETYDGAMEYKNVDTRDSDVKKKQTPAALTGFELLSNAEIGKVTGAQIISGEGADTDIGNKLKAQNPVCIWYEKNGFNENHHADIKFFYRRRYYTLGFLNNNVKSTDQQTRNIYYQMDINSTGIRGNWVYYEPVYPDADMRNYYYFDGWYYDEDHTRKVPIIKNDITYADNDHPEGRTHFADNDFKMPADDVTLYAKWSLVKENVRFYNDYEAYSTGKDPISSCDPEYNSLILTQDIPTTNHEDNRPNLTPPVTDATFTGWYYVNEAGEELRFEPENIPVVRELNLYAKWTSEQSAGYLVEYVEKGTDTPVADPVTGVAYVTTTKSFNAKVGNELNEAHRPQANQKNWWPVVSSHSIVIKANEEGEDYAPNVYRFEYTKKENVWYTVKYLDAATLQPIFTDEEKNTSQPMVTETYIPKTGYMPDRVEKTLAPAASVNTNTDEAKAEELAMNTIVFLYTKKDSQALVRIEHYLQKPDGDPADKNDYEHYRDERITKTINDTLNLEADVYTTEIATALTSSHYVINKALTEVYVNNVLTTDLPVTVTNDPLVIKVYYQRSKYPYKVIYVDWEKERLNNLDPVQYPDKGILNTIVTTNTADWQPIGSVVNIVPESPYVKDGVTYLPVNSATQPLTIHHEDDDHLSDPQVNVKTIYYRKQNSVRLNYEIVCEGAIPGDLQLSHNYEIVMEGDTVVGCTATDYSDVQGRYTFLGWYRAREADPEYFLASNHSYIPSPVPINDTTYYAIFKMNSAPYTLNYVYQGRKGGNDGGSYVGDDAETDDKVYTVNLEVDSKDLNAGKDNMPIAKVLVDHAPAVDDLYKDCIWTINDDHVTYDKTTRTVTITAVQTPRKCLVEFYYGDHKEVPDTIDRVSLNSLVRRDGEFITAPEKDGDNPFAYWSVVENDKEIARCYSRSFNLRVTGDITVTACYTADAVNVLSISNPEFTREQYTDESGEVNKDFLYADFILSYMNRENMILLKDSTYKTGLIIEFDRNIKLTKADSPDEVLGENDKVVYEESQLLSEEELKAFAAGDKTFDLKNDNTRALYKYSVNNASYNNKNRVDKAVRFNNTENFRHYVFRAYYYVIDDNGNTELSNPVYFYLYDIGNSVSATATASAGD